MKTRTSKSPKINTFPKFWSKNEPFFQLFFLGNLGQGNVFYYIVEQKYGLSEL